MSPADSDLLAAHRRDTRVAVVLHAVLLIGLIVLWAVNARFGVLRGLEAVLTQLLFGGT